MGNRSVAPLLLHWATIALGWLIPRFSLRKLPAMLAIAALGALAASIYGVLHDQITYTISPEYFTNLKFEQFAWANLGLPPRVFVAQIGLLASWWVGLLGGWFVARGAAWESSSTVRWPLIARAFGIVAIFTLGAGLIGWLLGQAVATNTNLSSWHAARDVLNLRDLPSFVVVAYIHNATYLGAALGTIVAVLKVIRR